ncbi:hypothetical protein BRADI_5g18155v3 [Brachypodium distachyon]|uniref:Uncharacterized protein n=1 Tax=Brachypodium distachyon TaxID=15368 RepID=A0A0Q3EC99_BRADI|nr:hypothetical protein BRADI_5g18155v3 [Brachypodium distachyon]
MNPWPSDQQWKARTCMRIVESDVGLGRSSNGWASFPGFFQMDVVAGQRATRDCPVRAVIRFRGRVSFLPSRAFFLVRPIPVPLGCRSSAPPAGTVLHRAATSRRPCPATGRRTGLGPPPPASCPTPTASSLHTPPARCPSPCAAAAPRRSAPPAREPPPASSHRAFGPPRPRAAPPSPLIASAPRPAAPRRRRPDHGRAPVRRLPAPSPATCRNASPPPRWRRRLWPSNFPNASLPSVILPVQNIGEKKGKK